MDSHDHLRLRMELDFHSQETHDKSKKAISKQTARIMSNTNILGIPAYYHERAASILRKGDVLATAKV